MDARATLSGWNSSATFLAPSDTETAPSSHSREEPDHVDSYRETGGDALLAPNQASTIQAALNAVQSGDTIRVADDKMEMRVRTMFWIL